LTGSGLVGNQVKPFKIALRALIFIIFFAYPNNDADILKILAGCNVVFAAIGKA